MGAVAYTIGDAVADTEGTGVEKVAVELAVDAEDIADTGGVVAVGTAEGGTGIVGNEDACLDAGITEGYVVGGGSGAVGTKSDVEVQTAETVGADKFLGELVAGNEAAALYTDAVGEIAPDFLGSGMEKGNKEEYEREYEA